LIQKEFTQYEKTRIINWYAVDNFSINEIVRRTKAWKPRITKILKDNNISINYERRNHKYVYNEDFFQKIDTEEKAYILGLLFADGSVHNKRNVVKLQLQDVDKEILEKISSCLIVGKKELLFTNNSNKSYTRKQNKFLEVC